MELSDLWNLRFAAQWKPNKILPPNNLPRKALNDTCVWCNNTVKNIGQNNQIVWSTAEEGTICKRSAASCKTNLGPDKHFRRAPWSPYVDPDAPPGTLPFDDFHDLEEAQFIADRYNEPAALEAFNDPTKRGQCTVGTHQTFTQLKNAKDMHYQDPLYALYELSFGGNNADYGLPVRTGDLQGLGRIKHIMDSLNKDALERGHEPLLDDSCLDKSCQEPSCHLCAPNFECGDHVSCISSNFCAKCQEPMSTIWARWDDGDGNYASVWHAVPPSQRDRAYLGGDVNGLSLRTGLSFQDLLATQAPPINHIPIDEQYEFTNRIQELELSSPCCINKNCSQFLRYPMGSEYEGELLDFATPWYEAKYDTGDN